MPRRAPNTEGGKASDSGTPSNWLYLVAACGRSLGQHETCTEWQQMLAGPSVITESGLFMADSARRELDERTRTAK